MRVVKVESMSFIVSEGAMRDSIQIGAERFIEL